ncbi:hypothetical protein [Legionella oakridgensis]|uniref:hypothetical protein n=1 Tax=Legionella oakridgensis TaxID=29423 RepID=UPI0003DE1623|nr:hypothetical protein [Legionella oakridgensis]ETO93817.1 hypothetical protein LOR_82c23360 [Legionella oakridgensis RV-2-2007]
MFNPRQVNASHPTSIWLNILIYTPAVFDAQVTINFIEEWIKLGNSWEMLNIPIVDGQQRIIDNVQHRFMQAIIRNISSFDHKHLISFMTAWTTMGKSWNDLNIPLTDAHQNIVGNLQHLLMQAIARNVSRFSGQDAIQFVSAWVKLRKTWNDLDVVIFDEYRRILGNVQRILLQSMIINLPSFNASETASLFWGLAKLERSWGDLAIPILDAQRGTGNLQTQLINALIRNLSSFNPNDLTIFLWAWGKLGQTWEHLNIPMVDEHQRVTNNLQQYLLNVVLKNLPRFNAHETINFLRSWSNMGNTWDDLNIPVVDAQQRSIDTFQDRLMQALIRNLDQFDLENTIDFLMAWTTIGKTWNDLNISLLDIHQRIIGNVQSTLTAILQKDERSKQFERYFSVLFNKMAIKAVMDTEGKYRAENQKLIHTLEQAKSSSEAILCLYSFCGNGFTLNQYSISKIIHVLGERFGLHQLCQHFYQTALNHHCANDYVRAAFMELCLNRGDHQMAAMTYRQAQQDHVQSAYMDKLYSLCQFRMMAYATHRQQTLFGQQMAPVVSDAEKLTLQRPQMRTL